MFVFGYSLGFKRNQRVWEVNPNKSLRIHHDWNLVYFTSNTHHHVGFRPNRHRILWMNSKIPKWCMYYWICTRILISNFEGPITRKILHTLFEKIAEKSLKSQKHRRNNKQKSPKNCSAFKLLSIPLSSTIIAQVFILSSTYCEYYLAYKAVVYRKNTC